MTRCQAVNIKPEVHYFSASTVPLSFLAAIFAPAALAVQVCGHVCISCVIYKVPGGTRIIWQRFNK